MPEMTIREAISKGLREALTDDRVFIMGEDVGSYGGAYAVTKGFLEEFGPQRIMDTPIAESVMVGAGVGAAMGGMKPIVEIMTINFMLLALDQLVNHAAKMRYMSNGQIEVPVVIRTVTGGQLGATHSQNFEGWFASVPGLKVAVPSTPYDALGLIRSSIKERDPVVIAEHAMLYGAKGEVPDEHYEVPFGQAKIRREGKDITLVAHLRMVNVALKVADQLAEKGKEAEVIDLRSLRPLDVDTVIKSVKKTNRVVVIDENWQTGGFAGELVSSIQETAFDHLDGPVGRVCGLDVPAPYSRKLEASVVPTPERVMETIGQLYGL
ncbi:MAG: alpha-ketoacid dehydrogenase subunit beta [Chloroflexi bacterium]|nr:alpha-ketoacid dehydrogenase subunit beta [Chloroflexota bacterium]